MQFVFLEPPSRPPYVLPPGVPHDRVAACMRKAFADTLKDPELIAEAEKMKLDMTFRPPDRLEGWWTISTDRADVIETSRSSCPGWNRALRWLRRDHHGARGGAAVFFCPANGGVDCR